MIYKLKYNAYTQIAISLIFASASATADKIGLEEVLVLGEKIERSLQDTASSVGVLSAEQLEESAFFDLHEAYTRLANVNASFGDAGFTIRGINYNSVSGGGNGGLASMHIDGAVVSSRALSLGQSGLWDMQQIEVFRGPQSTNQGRNSLAGAVFLRSKDPTYTPSGSFRGVLGNDNMRVLSASYGNAIVDDSLAFRLAVDSQRSDGFISNALIGDDKVGETDDLTIRGKLLLEPNAIDGLSIIATGSYARSERGQRFISPTAPDGSPINPFAHLNFPNVDGRDEVEQTMGIIEARYALNQHWDLTSISAWNRTDFDRIDDGDNQSTGGAASRTRDSRADIFTQELRISFTGDRYKGNLGAYYFKEDRAEAIDDLLANNVRRSIRRILPTAAGAATALLYPDPVLISRVGQRSTNTRNWAMFGNIDYDFSDFITLFAGFRYDNERVDNLANEERGIRSILPIPSAVPAELSGLVALVNSIISNAIEVDALDNNANYDAFLPKAGITLNWTDDLSTSLSVQRAYRAGGAGTSAAGNYDYAPEYTTNYELALRSQWLDRRLVINANLFYVDWEDQQVQITEPEIETDFFIENAGQSKLFGAELEITAVISEKLDVFANFGVVKTEFTEFPANEQLGTEDFSGNQFLAAPELTAAAGFSYEISEKLRLQTDINYQSESYVDVANEFLNDSRTLVNTKVSYQISNNVELALLGQNLFDEEYISLNGLSFGTTQTVGTPRSVAIQLRGSW